MWWFWANHYNTATDVPTVRALNYLFNLLMDKELKKYKQIVVMYLCRF
jgi:hypothetical protein